MLEPAFDGTWYVEVSGETIEARSLRELRDLVSARVSLGEVEFPGYYPNGTPAELIVAGTGTPDWHRTTTTKRSNHPNRRVPKVDPVKEAEDRLARQRESAERARAKRMENYETRRSRAIDEWFDGKPVAEIAAGTGFSENNVRVIVSRARLAGDARAIERKRERGNQRTWTKEDFAMMRAMAAKGYSAGIIANSLGTTRNAVIGQCKRRGITLHGIVTVTR